jgi:hypothetical protein
LVYQEGFDLDTIKGMGDVVRFVTDVWKPVRGRVVVVLLEDFSSIRTAIDDIEVGQGGGNENLNSVVLGIESSTSERENLEQMIYKFVIAC